MKKFQTNQEKLIMVSTSALAGVMIVTNFIGCSRINPETSGESITNDPSNSNIESLKESTSLTNESSENIEMYSFTWSDALSDKFSNYCKKVFNINLVGYIRCFGLTDELNAEFTKFVNTHFGTKYDKVPFKKANYFYSYIYSEDGHYLFRDYTRFSKRFLNDKKLLHGTFNNKLILSYLIANKIELGKMIPIDNFKSMFGDKIYSGKEYFDFCINNPLLGNYESSHKYSEDEIHAILIYYNSNLSYLIFTYFFISKCL